MESNQRLFRLTSRSNDGVFDTLFNEDIDIVPGSSIALQSASFDRESEIVNIDSTNNDVSFSLINKGGVTPWNAVVPNGKYSTIANGEKLQATITEQLNRVVGVDAGAVANKNIVDANGYEYSPNLGSQWSVELNNNGGTSVRVETETPLLISDSVFTGSDTFNTTCKFAGVHAPIVTPLGERTRDSIGRPTGGAGSPTDYTDSYAFGKLRWCKGASSLRMRLAGLDATGTGTVATMGLVAGAAGLEKLEKGTLANGDIHFALQVAGQEQVYRTKLTAAGSFADAVQPATGSTPGADIIPAAYTQPLSNAAGQLNDNDVLEIQLNGVPGATQTVNSGPSIDLLIHQQGESFNLTPTTAPALDQSTDYYWFISFHQDSTQGAFDMVESYADPYLYNTVEVRTNVGQTPIQQSSLPSVIRQGLYGGDPITSTFLPLAWPLDEREASVDWGSKELATFFGYDNTGTVVQATSFAASESYDIASDKRVEFSVTAKNYILLFDTVPINSFDTYSRFSNVQRDANTGGARQNILATIPTTEDQIGSTGVTRIAYEPSTPNYISLRNRDSILTRNLSCRLMTSTYEPVIVDGMASLTVLIRG